MVESRSNLRHGRYNPECLQCLEKIRGLLSALESWEGTAFKAGFTVEYNLQFRMSCEESLAGTRLCYLMGLERSMPRRRVEVAFGTNPFESELGVDD